MSSKLSLFFNFFFFLFGLAIVIQIIYWTRHGTAPPAGAQIHLFLASRSQYIKSPLAQSCLQYRNAFSTKAFEPKCLHAKGIQMTPPKCKSNQKQQTNTKKKKKSDLFILQLLQRNKKWTTFGRLLNKGGAFTGDAYELPLPDGIQRISFYLRKWASSLADPIP